MKKQLLLAAVAVASFASAQAGVDPATYETIDGITCKNEWLISRALNNDEFAKLPFYEDWDRVRTATVLGDKIYCGYSHKVMVGDELNSGSAFLLEFDLYTGEFLRTIQCTLDGEPISDLLCANQVGADDFGHLWFSGFVSTLANRPITIYVVDDLETGACSVAMECALPEDEAECSSRVDYCDLVGDVTGKEAGTVVMACSCEGAEDVFVYGWQRDQDSDKVEPHMSDGGYVAQPMLETYPEGQTCFNYGSMVYIVRDEDFEGNTFYTDGFSTYPTLYDTEGQMLESFGNVEDQELRPRDVQCNGAYEFTLGADTYFVFPCSHYNNEPGWQIRIAKLGENLDFAGMKALWDLPADGLGSISDSGMRVHPTHATKVVDANGKEAVYLFQYKCNGGMGLYLIAEEGFSTDGVQSAVVENTNAPVEYFNLAGQRVAANDLQAGLYITRQGSKASKVIVK